MKIQTYKVVNLKDIEESEKLNLEPPEEIREPVDLWLDEKDIRYAYVTNRGNINLHLIDGDFITVCPTNELIEKLDKLFSDV